MAAIDKSYIGIRELITAFRRSGGSTDDFNITDNPGTFYFRIFFDFTKQSGLLGGVMKDGNSLQNHSGDDIALQDAEHRHTVEKFDDNALNYLMVNGEWERATFLKQFIQLLSNISSKSPWYFSALGGVDELLKITGYQIGDQSPALTIKCLPDAYDTRIGTLLDLYKTITWSKTMNRLILPENLCLFDMYIYIFHVNAGAVGAIEKFKNTDRGKLHNATFDQYAGSSDYIVSSKLIELHGCELDPNSSSSGYSTVDNKEGFPMEYTLTIKPRRVYEQRYNEFLGMRIGDMILADLFQDGSGYSGWDAEGGGNVSDSTTIQDPQVIWDQKNSGQRSQQNTFVPPTKLVITDTTNPDEMLGVGDSMKTGNSTLGKKLTQIGNKVMGDVAQVGGAVGALVNSYNPLNLAKAGLNAAGDMLNKITFGNLFHTTINDITTNVSSQISKFSADSLINTSTHNGWTRTERSNPGRSIGGNLFRQ